MFTPLFFVMKPYTWGLLGLSAGLLIRWEITFYKHPERFSDRTNDYLRCRNCTEKLCSHKKQLKKLWEQIAVSNMKKRKHFETGNDRFRERQESYTAYQVGIREGVAADDTKCDN